MMNPILADETAKQGDAMSGILGNPLIMIVIFIVLFWVLLIRPQRKAMKEQQARMNALKAGDKVVTNAGIHGSVAKVSETTVNLRIAEGVQIEIDKAAVVKILGDDSK